MRAFNLFRKKKTSETPKDRVAVRFQTIVNLIRGLDEEKLACLKEGIDLVWQGWQKVSQSQTMTEEELDTIDGIEKSLEELNNA